MSRSSRRDRAPRESEGGRVVLYLILGLGLLAGCLYVGAYLGATNKVPVGTRVGGVDIGGHTMDTAVADLRSGLADRAKAAFTVTVNGHTQQIRPRQVGLGVDYVASVRAAGATRSWSLKRLWGYYTGGQTLQPVVNLDQLRLQHLVRQIDADDGRSAVNAAVTFRHDQFVVTRPVTGLSLDPKVAARAFWDAYLSDDPTLQLQLSEQQPEIGVAQVHRFVTRFANPALSSAVVLAFGQTTLRLEPSSYAHLLGSRVVGHHLAPTVDAAALGRLVEERLRTGGGPSNAPVDATVALVNGQPQVVPSQPGVTFAPADVGHALLKAIRSTDRTARVPASLAPAKFTNADARKLQIRKQISSFTVDLPQGSPSQHLLAAAVRLDNTVLKPGDTFSLRGRLGGGVPSGGRGDALATALFNAAWLGGLDVGTHASLSSYTRRYPVGTDASLANGQDLVFSDNTLHGVLVSVEAGRPTRQHAGSLAVTLWSTPVWKVTSSHTARTDVVPNSTVVDQGKGCEPRQGSEGFDLEVDRSFASLTDGTVDHQDSYVVHYAPLDAIVCQAAPHHHHHHHHHQGTTGG